LPRPSGYPLPRAVALPELFHEFEQYRLLAFDLMLMVLMVFRPQGLLTFRGRQAVPEEAPEAAPELEPPAAARQEAPSSG
jgi:hypothetical protein